MSFLVSRIDDEEADRIRQARSSWSCVISSQVRTKSWRITCPGPAGDCADGSAVPVPVLVGRLKALEDQIHGRVVVLIEKSRKDLRASDTREQFPRLQMA